MRKAPTYPHTRTAAVALGALALGLAVASVASAHSGGLNRDGCHTNRSTGDYHCHRAPAVSAPRTAPAPAAQEPVRLSGDGEGQRSPATPSRAFVNCDAARAAGATPVRRGDPGYGPHLDRDNDGVGCEPYRGRR